MILQNQSRNNQLYSQIELGVNSNSPKGLRECAITDCTSDYPQLNLSQKLSHEQMSQNHAQNVSIMQLRTKLFKLAEQKSNIDLKFSKHIKILKSELNDLNKQNQVLKQVSSFIRSDVEQMKRDLAFIKQVVNKKQVRLSLSPDLSKNFQQVIKHQRQSPRTKHTRLFKQCSAKIK